jgi:CelD/BcsL family acetyltransferase involved in cellulose biosynthesis
MRARPANHPPVSRRFGASRPGRSALFRREVPSTGLEGLHTVRQKWNTLAELSGSPFLTYEWLASSWTAFGDGQLRVLLLRSDDGRLRAGACCRLAPNGELTAPIDAAHGYEWDVVAVDETARRDAWDELARLGARRVQLAPVIGGPSGADLAVSRLRQGGYRVLRGVFQTSPYVPLPTSWDDMLGSVSRKLRSQWRSARRSLDADGLILHTAREEADVERHVETFLRLEASGWKGRAGTAILCDQRAAALYRGFALAAARQGWVRISVLESGGVAVAASLGCAFGGKAFRLKSGFDERYAARSPGLVLLGEEMRRSIEEGLSAFELLGAADAHKLRWTAKTRELVALRAYRGPAALPAYTYRSRIRPLLGRARRAGVGLLRRGERDVGA